MDSSSWTRIQRGKTLATGVIGPGPQQSEDLLERKFGQAEIIQDGVVVKECCGGGLPLAVTIRASEVARGLNIKSVPVPEKYKRGMRQVYPSLTIFNNGAPVIVKYGSNTITSSDPQIIIEGISNLANDIYIYGTTVAAIIISGTDNQESSPIVLEINSISFGPGFVQPDVQLSIFNCILYPDSISSYPETLNRIQILGNNLSALTITDPTSVVDLVINNNNFSDIDFTEFPNITYFSAESNNFNTINLSSAPQLTSLSISNNNLTAIDVSGLTLLTQLYVTNNNLTAIDVSGLTMLTNLNVSNNNLTAIDVSGLTVLTELYASECDISSVVLANNQQLSAVDLSGNRINQATLDAFSATLATNALDNTLTGGILAVKYQQTENLVANSSTDSLFADPLYWSIDLYE
jgi:hypothetical protein